MKKIDNTGTAGTTVFVYNACGQLIAEYHSDPVPPPTGGGGTSYLTTDHLGSTRLVTSASGVVKARYDYLPFGEEVSSTLGVRSSVGGYGVSDGTRQKFTQKERDSESGLDYFLARYYSSAQGRFTSADEPFADQEEGDPQSWNLYAYAGNNPLLYVDPTGRLKKVKIGDTEYWQIQNETDDYKWLSKKTGIPEEYLRKAYGNATLRPGELLDVREARQLYIQTEFSRLVWIVPSENVPQDRWRIELNPLPIPGKLGGLIAKVNRSTGGAGKWIEIRQAARELASTLLKQAKQSAVGAGARSGQHGKPFTVAAAKLRELLRQNEQNWLPEFKDEVQKKIQELESKAKTISHPYK